MKSSVEPLEGNKVKVYVEVSEEDFDPFVAAAWSQLAKDVRLPGFRKGKVPRKVLEARMGAGYARQEAVQAAVPDAFLGALSDNNIDAIGSPEYELTGGLESGPLEFEAIVTVRPKVEVDGYASIAITIPTTAPDDDAVADAIDKFRQNYAELVTVDRPAAMGDIVDINLRATDEDGETFGGLDAENYSYSVGTGTVVPELDDALVGLSAGDDISFTAAPPAGTVDDDDEDPAPIQFTGLVNEVKEQVLPDLTDQMVTDATDFESVEALRDNVVESLAERQLDTVRATTRQLISQELANLVDVEPPVELLDEAVSNYIDNLTDRFGGNQDVVLQMLGLSTENGEEALQNLRDSAKDDVKSDLALRAVAAAQGLEATDEDVDAELAHLALHMEMTADQVRDVINSRGRMVALRADVSRRKAMDWLIDTIDITSEDGIAVDRNLLKVPEHDHEHDDHEHGDHGHDDESGDNAVADSEGSKEENDS